MYYIPCGFYGGDIYTEEAFEIKLKYIDSNLEYYIKHCDLEEYFGFNIQKNLCSRYFSEVALETNYKNSDLIFVSSTTK